MKSFILEKVGKVYSSGCCMLYLNISLDDILDEIKKEDLAEDEIEDESHITLLYGLDENTETKDIKDIISKIKFGEISLNKVSIFENEQADVLKFDVSGEGLNKAFDELSKLPNENKYKDYKPHTTLAYLKSGKGKEYVEKFKNLKMKANPMFVVYSPGNNKDKIIIGIEKK